MTKTISFLIPVYNEEKRLIKTVTALKNVVIPVELKLQKIIFVNDGSKDNTLNLLIRFKNEIETATNADVDIVSYPKNKGKGYAIKTGMSNSDSDYTLFFDADMATPLTELSKFVPFIQDNTDVIVGTRKNGHSTVINHQPKIRELMGKVYTFLSQLILNVWITDFTCGFKAFSRLAKDEIFSRSTINRWGYDSEILFLAKRLGFLIVEKAVIWSDDRNTRVKLTSAVFTSFIELIKIRINEFAGRYNIGYFRKIVARFGLASS
ncbi:hypothetical protein A2V49_00245 [candidate division WWE3 bacterium RBG_19FT_COMBO_34_6]|uniref:Glycosyltransferase 2-like domain-containing protein n=1 Tax=candidate division WWE3 bacterium RBG_19FT_COMBO_34_6 TaxID=1802612 RepID=A0A1F4UMJ7_UNCKA|nr:MAG: hypothetical protein A2V49_00245 [candidate division WWE3 bacterium RBG_19FT_COMBO_34_6]